MYQNQTNSNFKSGPIIGVGSRDLEIYLKLIGQKSGQVWKITVDDEENMAKSLAHVLTYSS